MRAEFNKLKETLGDAMLSINPTSIALNELEQKITEVEKRMVCVDKSAEEINNAISRYTQRVDNNETFIMSINDHDSIMRGSHDIEIALDLNDKEVIENNWYGLFVEPKKEIEDKFKPRSVAEYVATLPKDEPPTYQSSEPETFDKVKQVIEILKTLHNGDCVDGETMQYILERIGMSDQMLRQLIMSNPESVTKDLLEERRILSNRGELYKKTRGCIEI